MDTNCGKMTESEYQGIYNILNEIKEDVNSLKVHYSQNSGKLDTLSREINKLSDDHEKMQAVIYRGNYGKNSLLEEIKISHSKIHNLEGKLETAKQDIAILEERWVKFLWALSVAVFLFIVSAAVTTAVGNDKPTNQNISYILVYSFLRL